MTDWKIKAVEVEKKRRALELLEWFDEQLDEMYEKNGNKHIAGLEVLKERIRDMKDGE